ncbi:MAG: UbiA family prenyltransferase [Pseudomonas sp.]
MTHFPLVVDLDGTLLRSDLLYESGMGFLKRHPLRLLQPCLWLLQGKAELKARLARAVPLDVAMLPFNQPLIALLREQRAAGRPLVLATASHRHYAEAIAEHLQLFDRVLATDEGVNLSAHNKRDLLVQEYGEAGFDYVGNSHDDLTVWEKAREAWLVDPHSGVERRARRAGNVQRVLQTPTRPLQAWLKAVRPHQWLKNLLLLVPLLASHQVTDLPLVLMALLAFCCFGLCASSAYLLNDLLDIADDRHHPSKCRRPLASGALSIRAGLFSVPLLLGTALLGSWFLPPLFGVALLTYLLLTLAYSFYLKRVMMLDVITLASLYTLRIIAGAFALGLMPTFWMLAFSMFIFLSLALVKRYAELRDARSRGETQRSRGRGYYPGDLEMLASLGAASGYLSVMVLALYIQDHSTMALYRRPELIWMACPLLLFWISRTWMLAHRGRMHDDPVVFAVKDRVSLLIGALFALTFWLAA